LNKEEEEILTSVTSHVSNHIPHPVNKDYISSLTPFLNLFLFFKISSIDKLAILSLTIETAIDSNFPLATSGT